MGALDVKITFLRRFQRASSVPFLQFHVENYINKKPFLSLVSRLSRRNNNVSLLLNNPVDIFPGTRDPNNIKNIVRASHLL